MSNLRKQLRADNEEKLDVLIDRATEAMADVLRHSGVAVTEMAKLIGQTRTTSLRSTILARMVNKSEKDLVELYNQQHEIPQTRREEKNAA